MALTEDEFRDLVRSRYAMIQGRWRHNSILVKPWNVDEYFWPSDLAMSRLLLARAEPEQVQELQQVMLRRERI